MDKRKEALEALVEHLLKKEFLPLHVRPMIEILGCAALASPQPERVTVEELAARISDKTIAAHALRWMCAKIGDNFPHGLKIIGGDNG